VAFEMQNEGGVSMKKRSVPKEERETVLNFNEADETAVIYTFNTNLKKRLEAFAVKHPDICKLISNDYELCSVTYEIQKSRVSIRLIAPYSEERRKATSEYAKKHGINNT
jgi:hypothetical protein